MSETDMREAIDRAVMEAMSTYKDAQKSPIDHGHAFVKGLDGRTSLARELDKHPAVRVDSGGYHGTTVHIDDVSRYLTAQRGAYDVFIKTLRAEGIDAASDMSVWARAN